MRILIETCPPVVSATCEVTTASLRWDVTARRFLMWEEIGDGAYNLPVDCAVVPTELEVRPGELRVIVRTPADAESLATALIEASARCQRSYERSRM